MWKTILGWLGFGDEAPAVPPESGPSSGAQTGAQTGSAPSPPRSSGPEPVGDSALLDVDLELPPPMSELTTEIPRDADVEDHLDEDEDADEEVEEEIEDEAPDPDSLDGDDLIAAFLDEVQGRDGGFDPTAAGPVGTSIDHRDPTERAELAVRALEHTAIEKDWARARLAVTLANHLLEQPLVLDVDQLTRFVEVFPRARPPARLLVGAFERSTPTAALVERAMQAVEELGGTMAPTHSAQLAALLEHSNESNESDFGLDTDGVRDVTIAGYAARLCAHPPRIEWLGKKGQVRKTIPKVVKRDAPDELAALEADLEALTAARERRVDALQALLPSDEAIPPDDFAAWLAHPLTAPLVQSLLWETSDGEIVQVTREGVSESVTLWDPRNSDASTVDSWRETLLDASVCQPFPQVWLDPTRESETTSSTGESRVALVARVLSTTELDVEVQDPWIVVRDTRVNLHTALVDGDTVKPSKAAMKAAAAVFVPHDRDPTLRDLLTLAFSLAS